MCRLWSPPSANCRRRKSSCRKRKTSCRRNWQPRVPLKVECVALTVIHLNERCKYRQVKVYADKTVLFALVFECLSGSSAPEVIKLTTKATPAISCPVDWYLFNSSCYYVSRVTRDWAESKSYCESQGGHLAIILTAEEQVQSMAAQHILCQLKFN